MLGLADFFFNLNFSPKTNKSALDWAAATIKISKYRTNLEDLLRPQTSKTSFVVGSFFAKIARRNIHLSTDSLFHGIALEEDCFVRRFMVGGFEKKLQVI